MNGTTGISYKNFELILVKVVPSNMKTILSIFFTLFLIKSIAQEYEVNGNIDLISYSQGGVELMPDAYMPHPLPNFTMFVVKYNGADKKPTVVGYIKTDSLGKFSTRLPEGKYGFLLTRDKSQLKEGQYLPESIGVNDRDGLDEIDFNEGFSHQDYWVLSTGGPFWVSKEGLNTVTITHYDVSICYMCP